VFSIDCSQSFSFFLHFIGFFRGLFFFLPIFLNFPSFLRFFEKPKCLLLDFISFLVNLTFHKKKVWKIMFLCHKMKSLEHWFKSLVMQYSYCMLKIIKGKEMKENWEIRNKNATTFIECFFYWRQRNKK